MSLEDQIRNGVYKSWSQAAKDAFDERIAIMREGNNIPDTATTPMEILQVASDQAREVMALQAAIEKEFPCTT